MVVMIATASILATWGSEPGIAESGNRTVKRVAPVSTVL